jgi:hypothetical protein
LHLFGKAMPENLEPSLVVKRVAICDQHQGEQRAHKHSCILLPQETKAPQKRWRRKRHKRCHEQDQYHNGIPPEPGSAPVQPAQTLPNFLSIGGFRIRPFWVANHRYQPNPHSG